MRRHQLKIWLCLLFIHGTLSFQVTKPNISRIPNARLTIRKQEFTSSICMTERVSEIEDFMKPSLEEDRKDNEISSGADTAALANDNSLPSENNVLPETQFWNGLLLLTAFGYAIYSLLNIDHGMMRGWSQSEIAMRIPLDNWASYEASLNHKPIWTKTIINVIIYLLGDWLSQTIFAKKQILDFDAFRTLRNGFIGLCFGPLVHLYYEFSDYILPVDVAVNRLWKIGMDQTIYLSVKCSIYIIAVNMLAGESFATSKDTVKTKLPGVMFTAWKFWPLVHCVTYGVIPARHRILWVNSVDLIWNAILATQTSKKESDVVTEDVGNNCDIDVPQSSNTLEEKNINEMELLQQEIINQESVMPSEIESSSLFQIAQLDLSSLDDTVISPITSEPNSSSEDRIMTEVDVELFREVIRSQGSDQDALINSAIQSLSSEIESDLNQPITITDTGDFNEDTQTIFQELDSVLLTTPSLQKNDTKNSTSVSCKSV